MSDPLKVNADLVDSLGSALRSGDHGLSTVPGLLKRVLREQSWRQFVTKRGDLVEHERWADFVTAKPLRGIGATEDLIRRIVANDPEVIDLLDRVHDPRPGFRSDLVDNINEVDRPAGTSAEQAIRRLRKDRPDLHAEVLAGTLSPHKAMVKAGLRPRTISVAIARPDRVAAALRRHMSPEDLAALRALLSD